MLQRLGFSEIIISSFVCVQDIVLEFGQISGAFLEAFGEINIL
jgi:hypothetical protein